MVIRRYQPEDQSALLDLWQRAAIALYLQEASCPAFGDNQTRFIGSYCIVLKEKPRG